MDKNNKNNQEDKLMARLLTYKETVVEYGVTLWFWKTQVWRGNLKNAGSEKKHLLDRKDIEGLIEKNKLS